MKKFLLLASLLFGWFISAVAIILMKQSGSKDIIDTLGITAILVLFGFYPFIFLLLINHKRGAASALEKILQWPFFGKKDKVPVNLGPWWANRLENAILLVTFVPFLLILFLIWLVKLI